MPLDPIVCRHVALRFGSGDYYLMCRDCSAVWMRRGFAKREYGIDKDGHPVGGAPEEANRGAGNQLSGKERIDVARATE